MNAQLSDATEHNTSLANELTEKNELLSRRDDELYDAKEKNARLSIALEDTKELLKQRELLLFNLKEDTAKILAKLDLLQNANMSRQLSLHGEQIAILSGRMDDLEFSAGMHICK